MIAEFTRPADR